MIAHVSGTVVDKYSTTVVVDVHGLGYEVQVSATDFEKALLKHPIHFYTYHHIREQSQDLFGFSDKNAKALFEKLLGVKSVGPKVALGILSIGGAEYIKAAIAGGDVKTLQAAKGVGKRAAEQIVVELRDKVGYMASDAAEDLVGRSGIDQSDEALQALIALGYSEVDAQVALKGVDDDISTEERIKQALKR